MIKITSAKDTRTVNPMSVTKVKAGETFLLPRYEAKVMSCNPHKTIADLMVVDYKIIEGPSSGKTHTCIVSTKDTIDSTSSSLSRSIRVLFRNWEKVVAGSILILVASSFVTYYVPGVM